MQLCSACGSKNPNHAKYCRACGNHLQATRPIRCPTCGANESASVSSCSSCGQPLEAPDLRVAENLSSQVAWSAILGEATAPTESTDPLDFIHKPVEDPRSLALRRLQSVVERDHNEYVLESLLEQSVTPRDWASSETSCEAAHSTLRLSETSSRPTDGSLVFE